MFLRRSEHRYNRGKGICSLSKAQVHQVFRVAFQGQQRVKSPVYIVQGAKDGIVPVKTAFYLFEKLQNEDKWIYISEQGKHHICFSEDCERWFEHVLKKLR